MTVRRVITMMLVLGVTCAASAQDLRETEVEAGRISDTVLGISFERVGNVTRTDSSTYTIRLQSSKTSAGRSAFAEVSTSDRLFVDLPGSYGGKLYLDESQRAHLSEDRVWVDTVNTGGLMFTREYWAVYAGMGMWEGVINCYVEKSGKYYIVSMIQDGPLGKPGEVVDGEPLTAAQLRQKVLFSLRDTTDQVITTFNKLLASVEIQN